MNPFQILHLSDLHIGKNQEDVKELAKKIGETLGIHKIDAVIFTGDIFEEPPTKVKKENDSLRNKDRNKSCEDDNSQRWIIDHKKKKEMIEKAADFFEELFSQLKSRQNLEKADFLFVEGNHDLYQQEYNNAWSLYDGFLRRFYNGRKPEQYKDNHVVIKVYDDKKKIFLGFSSNIDEDGTEGKEKFIGHISICQLEYVDDFLSRHQEKYQEYDRIAFFHHPCDFFEEEGLRNTDGIMNNSLDVSKKLAEWNVKLVLHGHKHFPCQSIFRPVAGQKIYRFAGGAIGKVRDRRSGYFIKMESKICLNEIYSDKTDRLSIESVEIQDDFMEGLLLKTIKGLKVILDDNVESVLNIINKLYLSYEQLGLLQYHISNICILENSIKYVLEGDGHEGFYGDLTRDEWNKIKELLNNEEISRDTRESLQNDSIQKCYVSFALLGKFFAKLYRKIARTEFVDWNINSTKFNVGNSCYYIYFKLLPNADGARARRELDGIMEGFQESLYELQEFLYCIKLKIKNVFLELEDEHNIKHCDFDASVPRLIQLLTGTNIYCHEYSFVRELIQNAIDAVSFREQQEKLREDELQILIELGKEENKNYFKIRDYGIGMKREIIERYFATLGKSYYKEYIGRKNLNYNSISNFGIGFLSVFKPCSKVIVHTKHFVENNYHLLIINNDQGHYTISSNLQDNFSTGTEIVFYLKDDHIENNKIIAYIEAIMLDIKYNIVINNKNKDKRTIYAKKLRCGNNSNAIFIPFDERKKEDDQGVVSLQYSDDSDWQMHLSESINYYSHGIFIQPVENGKSGLHILSAGIWLQNANMADIFGKDMEELHYMQLSLNFPPNWLDIDVSREKVNSIREEYIPRIDKFKLRICNELKRQVRMIYKYEKTMRLGFFKELFKFVSILDQSGSEGENLNVWNLNIHFFDNKIMFNLKNENEEQVLENIFKKWVIKTKFQYENDASKRNHETIKLLYESLSYDEVSDICQIMPEQNDFTESRKVLQKLELKVKDIKDKFIPIIPAVFLDEKNQCEEQVSQPFIEAAIWGCMIQDVEETGGNLFFVDYDNLEQGRFAMESDPVENRIDRIKNYYRQVYFTEKYDFIWNYIIWNNSEEYIPLFKDDKESVRRDIEKEYDRLKKGIKIIYIKGTDRLIDIYTIASCYMGALMNIPKEKLEFKKGLNFTAKYSWILNVGLGFLYMWMLSEENTTDQLKSEKRKKELYRLYNQKKLKNLLDGKVRDRCIQLLAVQERRTFDVLCFAELLRWIDDYIKTRILT